MSNKLKVGQELQFLQYEEPLEEGMEAFFEEGDTVIVESIIVEKDGKEKKVKSIDVDEGADIQLQVYKEGSEDMVDTVYFPGEVDFFEDAEEEAEEEEKPKAKKTASKKKAPAKKTAAKKTAKKAEKEEVEEEAKKPAPKKKTASKKTAAKKAPAKKSTAKKSETKAKAETKKPAAKKTSKKTEAKKSTKAKKETAKKAPARTETEEHQEELSHTKTVEKMLKKQDALEAAKALVQQSEQTFISLGGVLCAVRAEGAHAELGYDNDQKGFEEYCERELHISYRKALLLCDIYRKLVPLGIDEEQLVELGYSKAAIVARYADEDNWEDLVDEALEKTRDEFYEGMKKSKVNAKTGEKTEKVSKVKYTFSAFGDRAEVIGNAIENAMETFGTDDMSEALQSIIVEWSDMTDGVEVPLEEALQVLEKKYGVELGVVEEDEEDEE